MDGHLRELERTAADGDYQDQGRLLRERVRAGGLEEWKLWAGTCLSDPASLHACDLPLDHSETLAELFDVLCTNAPARVVLKYLQIALKVWGGWEQKQGPPAVPGAYELRNFLDDLDVYFHPQAMFGNNPIESARRVAAFPRLLAIGNTLWELVQAFDRPGPFGGTNPIAVGHWLDGGGMLHEQPMGGVALRVKLHLREFHLHELLHR